MSAHTEEDRPWEILEEHLLSEEWELAVEYLKELTPDEQRRALSRLSQEDQSAVVEHLPSATAAEVLENLPEAQAADILEYIEPAHAADILEELPDEVGADLLQEMAPEGSEAVLAELDDIEEVEHLRELTNYRWDSAGGLMTESFAAFTEDSRAGDVVQELSSNAERYADMDVQYVYIVNETGALCGVLPLRQLVLTPQNRPVKNIMLTSPVSVNVDMELDELAKTFEAKNYIGLPVVDTQGIILGVVSREAVREARAEQQTEDFLSVSGIVGGEELRSMPMHLRVLRRLSWLAPNILLNLVAASIIALYLDTIEAVTALAVFLPIVSDMSGCSGNQAVAVSMRELTLGILRPSEFMRVVWKEGILGIINGSVLGTLLGTIAGIWHQNFWLGAVIALALALNTVLSVLLGGLIPLAMKRMKVDPALASGPILTTCTDMCGFFLVLNFAGLVLSRLV